jgi:hypothetical protein
VANAFVLSKTPNIKGNKVRIAKLLKEHLKLMIQPATSTQDVPSLLTIPPIAGAYRAEMSEAVAFCNSALHDLDRRTSGLAATLMLKTCVATKVTQNRC